MAKEYKVCDINGEWFIIILIPLGHDIRIRSFNVGSILGIGKKLYHDILVKEFNGRMHYHDIVPHEMCVGFIEKCDAERALEWVESIRVIKKLIRS